MSWLGLAGLGLGVADMFKDGPDTYSPWQQGHAAWQINNPNRYTPFGSVEYIHDDAGTRGHFRDDIYTIEQKLSPEMQALADRLLGFAGRGRETFTSGGMGELLSNRMDRVLGARTPSTYDRGQLGFEQTGDPAMVPKQEEDELLVGGYGGTPYDPASYESLVGALMETRNQYAPAGAGGGGFYQRK